MVQLHWWDYSIKGLEDTMCVLADLQAEGQVLSLGVTNMNTEAIVKIIDADVKIASNQVCYRNRGRSIFFSNAILAIVGKQMSMS